MTNKVMELRYTNAAELMDGLSAAASFLRGIGVDARDICVVTTETNYEPLMRVFEETLTDGSKTYAIAIRG